MRFTSRLATILATSAAAAGAIAAGPPESGFDRPGGVYANVPAEDAAACAIACAQDKICMSWSFRTTDYVGCSLKAVVPARKVDANASSGVADRAADFLSLVAIDPPAPPAPAPIERLQAAALTAVPTLSRPLVISLVHPARMAPIAPLAAEEETPALIDKPPSFALTAANVLPIRRYPPATVPAAPLSSAAPILTIETPAPFQRAAIVNAPAPHRPASVPAASLPALSLVLAPEAPRTLDAPVTLRTTAAVLRIAARPFANAVAPLASAVPITQIAFPAPLNRAPLSAPPAPFVPPLSRTGLGAQVTLAIPPSSAPTPSPPALPAAYAGNDRATFANAAVSAADEEELLGAP